MKKVELSQGFFALVDDVDYDVIKQYKWRVLRGRSTYYAVTDIEGESWSMHKFLMGLIPGMEVDHIDKNGLNNQRSNLRLVTCSQNRMNSKLNVRNTSGFRGVSQHPTSSRWRAQIGIGKGKVIGLGSYNTLEEAARAYDKKALELYGEHTYLNFPLEKT